MLEVFSVQSDIVQTYRQDFPAYAPRMDRRSLDSTILSVARNIGHQIKYTRLAPDYSGPTSKKAFDILNLSLLVHTVRSASPASIPLGSSVSESRFKALMVDIGLLRALNDLPANMDYLKSDLLALHNGALAEQFVGQEFISAGAEHLYYWSREARSSSAEVDYLIVAGQRIIPVEVKSGAAGKLKSLHILLRDYPGIRNACVLSSAPYSELPGQRITFLPLYYAYRLQLNEG
jgi:hypothetical protein